MKNRRTFTAILTLLLGLLLGVACSEARNAAAKGNTIPSPHHEYGTIESGDLDGPVSTAVTLEFDTPFEAVPVCTMAHQPSAVGAMVEGEKEAAPPVAIQVVLMNVTVETVTFFVNNPNDAIESTVIHAHCIGQ